MTQSKHENIIFAFAIIYFDVNYNNSANMGSGSTLHILGQLSVLTANNTKIMAV